MKRAVKLVAQALGGLIVLVLLAVAVVVVRGGSKVAGGKQVALRPPAPRTDSAARARGQHIAEAIAPCAACHGPGLAGKAFGTPPILVSMAAPNLTPAGVGAQYVNADWDAAIRHGVAKDGRRLLIMPSEEYSALSDGDFAALVAYLQSLPASGTSLQPRKVGLLGRALVGAGAFPLAADRIVHEEVGKVSVPEGPTAEYGKYLTTVGGCGVCHGSDFAGKSGNNGPSGPNLRPLAGSWSVDDFRRTIRTGVDPKGHKLDPELMPWQFFAKMTDDELAAIWAHIRSVASSPVAGT